MARFLLPKKEVLGDSTPLTSALEKRAQALLERRDAINEASLKASRRARQLPSSLPGYTDATIGDALAETQQVVPKSRVYFSEERLRTPAGIRNLEKWNSLGKDEVASLGARDRSSLLNLGAALRERQPNNYKAAQFYGYVTQLDRQAVFVLSRSGFMDRVRAVLGDAEKGQIDTDKLLNAFGADFDDMEWDNIIQELKNARQYNRSRLGNL